MYVEQRLISQKTASFDVYSDYIVLNWIFRHNTLCSYSQYYFYVIRELHHCYIIIRICIIIIVLPVML